MAWSGWRHVNNKAWGRQSVRWVFYSLLVVNLVYLGWQLASDAVWGAGPSPLTERADAGESSDAPALRLLSEACLLYTSPSPRDS